MASLRRITLLQKAADLRKHQTNAEARLWRELKGKKLGVRFRRQRVKGNFILDFYCASRRLAIEVDGSIHDKTRIYDAWRDRQLQNMGIRVLRFRNERVFSAMEYVLEEITEHLEHVHEKSAGDLPEQATSGAYKTDASTHI
jgi:very-short-patch-repair endonuclease